MGGACCCGRGLSHGHGLWPLEGLVSMSCWDILEGCWCGREPVAWWPALNWLLPQGSIVPWPSGFYPVPGMSVFLFIFFLWLYALL